MQHKNALPDPSPRLTNEQASVQESLQLIEAINTQPNYVTESVDVNTTSFVPEQPMVRGATNAGRAVHQDLYGVVRAGGDMFGIVRVRAGDHATGQKADGFILTQFDKEGGRAKVVGGFKEGQPLSIGRNHQKGLDSNTSRDHFKIGMREGKIVVGEDGKPSTNGTALIRVRSAEEVKRPHDETQFGFSAFKRGAGQKLNAKNGVVEHGANPLDNFELWSAKSHDAKEEVFSMISPGGGRYIDTTHEASKLQKSNRVFDPTYNSPEDQFGVEMHLREAFSQQFPEEVPVLNEALSDLQRMIGIDVPKYSVSEEDRTVAQLKGMADEFGFMPSTDPGNVVFSSVLLQMPKEHTPKQIAAMSDQEKAYANATASGMTIVGELPPSTRALIEGMYSLTGASIVRDGRVEGDDPGEVIRKGLYNGEDVYFSEGYHDASSYYAEPMFSLYLLGPISAMQQIEKPNNAQIREFIATSGIKSTDLIKTFVDHKVTKHNYQEIAHVLGETRKIVDGE